MVDTIYVVIEGLRDGLSKISISISSIATTIGVFTLLRVLCCK